MPVGAIDLYVFDYPNLVLGGRGVIDGVEKNLNNFLMMGDLTPDQNINN